jgi:pimeloyl-ACP methyl ester carboxylesterase
MPRIRVEGAELYYEDTGGSGPAVVFAHGLLWSTAMYRFQVEAFRDRYRCIAFDFRGQGRSEVTGSGYDMDTLARDAAQVIEALGVPPVHFVGLSMGGFVGIRLAARRPELVRSLALLETAADAEPRASLRKYRLLALVSRIAGTRVVAGRVMEVMFGETFLRDPARAGLRDELRRALVANDLTGELRALEGVLSRAAVEGELARIRVPTVVVSGEEERAISPARSRRLADGIPGARFVAVPRAGHTSTIEEPEAVNAVLGALWAAA